MKEALKLADLIQHFDSNDESLPLELLKEIAATLRALAQPELLMKRPIESDYSSHVAYTRALEAYCDSLAQPVQEPVAKYIGECNDGSLVQLYEDVTKGTVFYTTPPKRQPLTCAWSQEDDDTMPGTYRSACGELWSFIDGGWQENKVRYCHGCGGKVVDAHTPAVEAAHGIKEKNK